MRSLRGHHSGSVGLAIDPLFAVDDDPLPDGFELVRGWLPRDDADAVLRTLIDTLPWARRTLVMGGREVLTPRLTCWVGPEPYRYSGGVEPVHAWTPELAHLRDLAGHRAGVTFNSVLANLYRDGDDTMGAHKDNEPQIGPVIASVNLGASRDFVIRHDHTSERHVLPLGHGDLLLMTGRSQRDWSHSVPRRARVRQTRINLTFRQWTIR